MIEIDSKIVKKTADVLVNIFSDLEYKSITVAFSGGIDSSLLAFLSFKYSKNIRNIELIYAGMEDRFDFFNSQQSAQMLNLALTQKILSEEKILEYRDKIKEEISSQNLVEISYLLPYYAVLQEAKYECVMTGQGSDELFLGYHKFLEEPDKAQEASRILYGDLSEIVGKREYLLAKNAKKELIMPFMDEKLAEIVLPLGLEYKIDANQNKILLRDVARYLGLPEQIAVKPKKAAQYGSGVWKVLKRNKT